MSVEDLTDRKYSALMLISLFTYLFFVPCFLKFAIKRNTVGINNKELSHT